jgi:hypothetical protein
MSDQGDCEFVDPDDAKAEIRAAVRYLLRGCHRRVISGRRSLRSCAVAGGLPREPPNSLDDGLPGG